MQKFIIERSQKIHTAKLEKLKETAFKKYNIVFNDDWFVNRTQLNFPKESRWLLSLGPKFALPSTKQNFSAIHTIADIEQCIQNLNEESKKETIRTKFSNRVASYKNKIRNTPREKFIIRIFLNTQKFIKEQKGKIIVTTSDKGNKTVIMDREDYDSKILKLLEDKNTYRPIRTDPTDFLQRKNNKLVNELYKNKYIDAYTKNVLICDSGNAPRFYGLPKIHKDNTPLRPICSSMNVPCYKLSQHVSQILRSLVNPELNIKNAVELKNKLNQMKIEEDEVVVSFDAVSLFTNIPINMTIKHIMKQWPKITNNSNIPRSKFLEILNFCLIDNNYFVHNKRVYNQIYGMPMGNPLSPTLADIVMDNLITESIEECEKNKMNIKFITKYVDDILLICKKTNVSEILEIFNGYHPKLKFTSEFEENNKIPYLNTLVIKEDGFIKLDWYQKNIASGRIINFLSNHPRNQIINTAKNLINTVDSISDPTYKNKNKNKLENILRCNNFPNQLIQKLLKNNFNKTNISCSITNNNTDGNHKRFFKINYTPKITDYKSLKEMFNNSCNNIKFALKPTNTLRQIYSNTKDKIEKEKRSNVVYEIPCKGNDREKCDQIYIGTTKRALGTRLSEHNKDVVNSKMTTALAQHMLTNNHKPDFGNIKILDIENKHNTRLTLESLRIQQKRQKTMNKKEDTDNISSSYFINI